MRSLIVAAALAAAVAGPAMAGPGDNPIRRLEWIGSNQKPATMDMTDAKVQWFKNNAKPLAAGTLVMTIDGRFYVLQDAKLPDGRMISEMLTH